MNEVNPKTGWADEAGKTRQPRGDALTRGLEQDERANRHQDDVQAGITAEGKFIVLRRQVEVEDGKGESKSRREEGGRDPQEARSGLQPSEVEAEQEVTHVARGIVEFESVFQGGELFEDEHDRHDHEPECDVVKDIRVFGLGDEKTQNGREKVQADERVKEPQVRGSRSAQDADEHLEDGVERHTRLGESVGLVNVIENGPDQKGDDNPGGTFFEERPGIFLFGEQEEAAHQKEERHTIAREGVIEFVRPHRPAAPHINMRQNDKERADEAHEVHPGEDAIGGFLFVFCQLIVHEGDYTLGKGVGNHSHLTVSSRKSNLQAKTIGWDGFLQ